jgi:hypothetical protein
MKSSFVGAREHWERRDSRRNLNSEARALAVALRGAGGKCPYSIGLRAAYASRYRGDVVARNENPLDEFVIEQIMASEMPAASGSRRQSAAIAEFSVALGRIAADALAGSGR